MHRWLVLILIAGCRVRGGVYYTTATPAHQSTFSQTATGRTVPVPSSALGEWVQGSDGSMGWRTATHAARAMFARVSDSVAQRCSVDSRTDAETRATCEGVTIFVRHDTTNLYRVCAQGTEPAHCVTTWNAIP